MDNLTLEFKAILRFLYFCLQNTLLQETYEEWEQCEKKLKDIRAWIDKTNGTLESIQFKKKPLRDQLGLCEKYIAEVNGQKTKITLSVEKLQVIFIIIGKLHSMQHFGICFTIRRCVLFFILDSGSFPIWHWWRLKNYDNRLRNHREFRRFRRNG